MLRMAYGTGALLIFLSSVCLAFPSADSSEEESLAAAIRSADLPAVRAAAEQVDLDQCYGLRDYVLRYGSAEIVRYLNGLGEFRITQTQIAVIDNDLKAVKRLVPESPQRPPVARLNDDHSPLRLAVRRGNLPMVKLLLKRKVPVNEVVPTVVEPWRKPSVLSEAIRLGNAQIVRLLVEAGSPLEEPVTTFVPVADATYQGKKVSEVLVLFEWKSVTEVVDYQRLAAEKEALLQDLLAKGLVECVDVPKANANCPLKDAINAGREKVVAVLLDAGANPNVSIGGQTRPLHIAAKRGHPGIVELLINAGADVNQPDAEGKTPLAQGFYHGDIADMLRAAGAKELPGIGGKE
jgi:ankyrin repeat protein